MTNQRGRVTTKMSVAVRWMFSVMRRRSVRCGHCVRNGHVGLEGQHICKHRLLTCVSKGSLFCEMLFRQANEIVFNDCLVLKEALVKSAREHIKPEKCHSFDPSARTWQAPPDPPSDPSLSVQANTNTVLQMTSLALWAVIHQKGWFAWLASCSLGSTFPEPTHASDVSRTQWVYLVARQTGLVRQLLVLAPLVTHKAQKLVRADKQC